MAVGYDRAALTYGVTREEANRLKEGDRWRFYGMNAMRTDTRRASRRGATETDTTNATFLIDAFEKMGRIPVGSLAQGGSTVATTIAIFADRLNIATDDPSEDERVRTDAWLLYLEAKEHAEMVEGNP